MDVLFNIGSWTCLLLGGFFCFSGGVGILRFPDFYARIHAAGVTDTLGAGLILTGLMLQSTSLIVLLKLVLVLLFSLLTGPTASHALAKAAMHSRLMPKLHNDKKVS